MKKNLWKVLLVTAVLCFAGCQESEETKSPVTNTPEVTKEVGEATEKTDLPDDPGKTDEPEVTETPAPTKGAEATETPTPTKEAEATETPVPTKETEVTETPAPSEVPETTEAPVSTTKPKATATPKPTATPKATATPKPTATPKATATPKPTGRPAPTMAPEALQTLMKNGNVLNVKQGDVVFLGRYEQDGDLSNGPEDIEWYVVGREGDKALLLSKYILDCVQYNDRNAAVSWEESGLREWLFMYFPAYAFTLDEWDYFEYPELENNGNPYLNVPGGEKTTDQIFVLSIDELEKYTPETAIDDFEWYWFGDRYYEWLDNAQATEYAIQNGVFVWPWEDSDIYKCGNWWLRSPGKDNTNAMFYNFSGFVDLEGFPCDTDDVGVRPAIWIDLAEMAADLGITEEEPEEMPEEEPVVQPENGSGLQANPEKVFSFNDIKFLGQSFAGMDIDKAEKLLKAEGLIVKREEKTSFDGEPYINVTGGYNEWMHTYWVTADVSSGIVDAWAVQDDYGTSGQNAPIGVRNIRLKDTLGKVLDRLGFANAYQVETELIEIISGVSEDAWFGGDGLEEAENKIYELFSVSGVSNLQVQAIVSTADYLSLTFYDSDFDAENGGNMHSYMMDFMRSEESNGEFALIITMMNIFIPE